MKQDNGWSPYLAGALSGVLIILSVLLAGKYFGASTTFVRCTAVIESLFSAERVASMDYFLKFRPEVDWQWMFVIGIMLGSLVSALTSKSFKWQAVPDMWEARFGPGRLKRGAVAFIGGAIAMFGARMAGGCTSGHGLSGTLQLSLSGLIVMASLFAGGVVVARILYGGGKK